MAGIGKHAILTARTGYRSIGGINVDDARPAPLSSKTFSVIMPDAPDLPIQHVNVLDVRFAPDELFLTFGVVLPPAFASEAEAEATNVVSAQPVFRCAVSRQVMQRFINIMASQYENQTHLLENMLRKATDDAAAQRMRQGEDE